MPEAQVFARGTPGARARRRVRGALAALVTLVAAGAVVAVGTNAAVALAQPRGKPARPARPKPAASASAEPAGDDRSAAPATSSSASLPQGTGSVSGPVPAPPAEAADGGKLSPLNPAANEFSDAGMPATSIDYDRLLADIGGLRARVAAVSDTLFHSRIAIALEASGDHGRIAALSVSLDDGVVWTSPPTFRPEDATVVYDHAVAPGHHSVTVDVERRDDRNDIFRNAQRSRFIVDVPADQRLAVDVKLSDDSSMGGDFPSDKSGQYELRIRARAKAQPLPR
jgi:hypothetical protein